MSLDREIDELYREALKVGAAERAALLAQAPLELREKVEAMFLETREYSSLFVPGAELGQYRVEAAIGEGGMGRVFRGRDTKLNRPVAIKVLSDELADAGARRRFQREAQMASSLNHPHILTVYDVGEADGRQYLVTEFVDGGTLKNWIKKEPRSWQDVVELLTGVADGLAAAHQAGILHRDIKPDNILVTTSGYAKLADFGLAKLDAGNEGQTRTGAIVGTIAYMSPEQASGKALDSRSDIFSFGLVLYEMLSGRRAFEGAGMELIQKVIHESPASLGGGVPLALKTLVAKMIEKEPANRYSSMRDVVNELRRVLRPEAAAAPAPNRMKWVAGGGVAVVLVVAGLVFWYRSRPAKVPSQVDFVRLTDFSDSAVAPALSPDGRMLGFIRGPQTFDGPGDVYVKYLPDGEPVQLTHDGGDKTGPLVFSADGSRIAFSVGINDTWTVPVLGGDPIRMLVNASGLSWIGSGTGPRRVLYSALAGQGNHMGVMTATESRAEERKVYLPADVHGMAHRSFLSPDGKSVLIVEMNLSAWLPCRIVPFDGSSAGRQVGPEPSQCTDAGWSPDGKWMYFSANTGAGYHIWRQRFPDGAPEQVTSGATQEQGISFAADGKSLVTSVGESQSTLWIHDAAGERQLTFEGYAYLPSFSADGKKLYYLQRAKASGRFVSGELWQTDPKTNKKQRLLPDFLMEHYNISADGESVIFITADGSGHAPLWIAKLDGSAAPRILSQQDCVRALFAPNGDIFFVGGRGENRDLQRIKPDGTDLRKILPEKVAFLYDVSPDGKWLSVWEGIDLKVYPSDGGSSDRPPILICAACAHAGGENRGVTPPMLSWSRDGRVLYLNTTEHWLGESTLGTYAIPLRPGQVLPPVSAGGLRLNEVVGRFPGTKVIPEPSAFMGPDPSTYAFPKVLTHRNIYRIAVQ